MKRGSLVSLVAAVSIVVTANTFALVHSARNRGSDPEAEVTLTKSELQAPYRSADDDDSGISLVLVSTDFSRVLWPAQIDDPPEWMQRNALEQLGFDCRVNPESPDAGIFYQRQRSRKAFVALENNGPAWQTLLRNYRLGFDKNGTPALAVSPETYAAASSHLVAIDVDLNAGRLRLRHPDRSRVIILPALIGITVTPAQFNVRNPSPQHPPQIHGLVQQFPSAVHIPRPFSDEFRRRRSGPGNDLSYRVHLRYGNSLEPWVAGVEFGN